MQDAAKTLEIEVIDSHTGGEPTRVIVGGFPDLGSGTMVERRERFRVNHDHWRRGVVMEPRGHNAIVGALLTPPERSDSECGVIFFNNVGYLGMCGHGLIGLAETLRFMGRVSSGEVQIDTPVGPVRALVERNSEITIQNVPAYVHRQDVEVNVADIDFVKGDVAYGGNWFYLTAVPERILHLENMDYLMEMTKAIKKALVRGGVTGADGAEIDHVELYSPSTTEGVNARNFVLCPGGEYDRSPCGTGTSAKMASLHARGELRPGQMWRQESITGSVFSGWLIESAGELIPHIKSRAFVTGSSTLRFQIDDPFRFGF